MLWAKELQRVDSLHRSLAKFGNPDADVGLAIAAANNEQMRGIALRHLKRYSEAIEALSESSARLQKTGAGSCVQLSSPSRCAEIDDLRALTATLEANVRADQHDLDGMARALGSAVVFVRQKSNYRELLVEALRSLFEREAFGQAGRLMVAEMQAAVDEHDDRRLQSVLEIAPAVYGQMFMGISWNLHSRTMRENDPRDFVDNSGIGIGRRLKYGMTNPEEDQATFVAAVALEKHLSDRSQFQVGPDDVKRSGYASAGDLLMNLRITDYVRSEMDAGNFEPAVKYLHIAWILGTLDKSGPVCHEPPPKFGFDDVARRLRTAPTGTVSPMTVDILNAFDEASRFVVGHCHARSVP